MTAFWNQFLCVAVDVCSERNRMVGWNNRKQHPAKWKVIAKVKGRLNGAGWTRTRLVMIKMMSVWAHAIVAGYFDPDYHGPATIHIQSIFTNWTNRNEMVYSGLRNKKVLATVNGKTRWTKKNNSWSNWSIHPLGSFIHYYNDMMYAQFE